MTMKGCFLFVMVSLGVQAALGGPKKYQGEQEGGFEPSSHRYYESNLPSSYKPRRNETEATERKSYDKSSKFGIIPISTYTGTGVGDYGNGNGGNIAYSVSPLKIDLAGVALGALIGLGAVLILPKLTNLLGAGGHGGYRMLEGDSSIPEILQKIDTALEQNDIDSNSCAQRVICSYVNDAKKNRENGETSGLDDFILALSNNTLMSNLMYGAGLKQAVELGRSGGDAEKCMSSFSKCTLTNDKVVRIISGFLPSSNIR